MRGLPYATHSLTLFPCFMQLLARTLQPPAALLTCYSTLSLSVPMAGEEVYVAMDKGPIDETHVLILPIEHYPSSGHMPPSAQAEAEAYLRALEACFAAQVRRRPSRG